MSQRTILFLCTGNSCRSQMAEAIVNARYPEWKAYSAGTRPAGYVHDLAIVSLNEIGIQHSGESKHIDELPTKDFDIVVTVCDSAAEECPVWPGKAGQRVHHSFVDPAKTQGTLDERMQVFRSVRDAMLYPSRSRIAPFYSLGSVICDRGHYRIYPDLAAVDS